ncbi:unnamed protein product, partial [Nesidiocoris tenuis]
MRPELRAEAYRRRNHSSRHNSFPWYELNPSDRKYFISMICSSREELKIDFYGMLALNYETLTVNIARRCDRIYQKSAVQLPSFYRRRISAKDGPDTE